MSALTFTFTKRLDSGNIQCSNSSRFPEYTIESKKSAWDGRMKTTYVKCAGMKTDKVEFGILWEDRLLRVGDTKRSYDGAGVLTYNKYTFIDACHWSDPNRKYQFAYDDKARQWTITQNGSEKSCASLTRRVSHLRGASEPATMTIDSDVPEEDMLFLLLITMFVELSRGGEKWTSRNQKLERANQVVDITSKILGAI